MFISRIHWSQVIGPVSGRCEMGRRNGACSECLWNNKSDAPRSKAPTSPAGREARRRDAGGTKAPGRAY